MFFLEVSVGQYLGVGGMSVVGQLAPIFKVILEKVFLFKRSAFTTLFEYLGCWLLCHNDGVP